MPITVELDEATLTTTLKITPRPDEQVEDKDVWQMDEQALHDHPEFSQNLRDAGFQYLGVVARKGKTKSEGESRTLLYARYEGEPVDAVQITQSGEEVVRDEPKDREGVRREYPKPEEPAGEKPAETPTPAEEEVTTPEEKTTSARRK